MTQSRLVPVLLLSLSWMTGCGGGSSNNVGNPVPGTTPDQLVPIDGNQVQAPLQGSMQVSMLPGQVFVMRICDSTPISSVVPDQVPNPNVSTANVSTTAATTSNVSGTAADPSLVDLDVVDGAVDDSTVASADLDAMEIDQTSNSADTNQNIGTPDGSGCRLIAVGRIVPSGPSFVSRMGGFGKRLEYRIMKMQQRMARLQDRLGTPGIGREAQWRIPRIIARLARRIGFLNRIRERRGLPPVGSGFDQPMPALAMDPFSGQNQDPNAAMTDTGGSTTLDVNASVNVAGTVSTATS